MSTSQYKETDLTLKNASLEKIAATASAVIYRNKEKKKNLSIKDVSGNSGAKTFICMDDEVPKCIVKVKGDDSIMSSHPILKNVLYWQQKFCANITSLHLY